MERPSKEPWKAIGAALLLLGISGCQVGTGVSQTGASPTTDPPARTQPHYVAPHEQWLTTGRPLDLVLDNSGSPAEDVNFFKLMSKSGEEAVTRYGSFQLDSNGTVVHSSGMFLSPMITLPPDASELQVRGDGIILFQLPGSTSTFKAGPVYLVSYEDPTSLISIGEGLFRPAGGERMVPPLSKKYARIYQGYLEMNFDAPTQ